MFRLTVEWPKQARLRPSVVIVAVIVIVLSRDSAALAQALEAVAAAIGR